MFFHKKNKNQKQEEKNPNKGIDIHVMPKKFLRKADVNDKGSNAAVFVLIFLIVLGVAAYFLSNYIFPNGVSFLKNNSNKVAVNDSANKNSNMLENENTNINENINDSILNRNYNTNTNTNANTNTSVIPVIPISSDKDYDTLTDIEEAIYKTNPSISDTDKDGFLDGQELANLYDPLIGGSVRIEDSSLIDKYINPTYGYSILYPKSWQVAPLGGGDQEITFVSSNKEFIEVTVMDNSEGLTAVGWYLNQIPKSSGYKAERVWANNFMGIKSLDGMHVYLTPISGKRNFIYTISYMVGSHAYISYPATFQMMIRSFDAI